MVGRSSLEQLLREVTVRVEGGAKAGAGFFVAPGLVVTCAHVTGKVDRSLSVRAVGADPVPVRAVRVLCAHGRPIPDLEEDYPDIALLEVDIDGHPCAALDGDWPIYGDWFQIYGYPAEGGSVVLTAATLSYRGTKGDDPTVFIDLASDTVKPGMSGGALLNLRSGAVCGVVVATRNPASPDGGLAVPWSALDDDLNQAIDANRRFHQHDHRWATALRSQRRHVRCRLPRVASHFQGRNAELDALESAFSVSDGAVIMQSITGLGGVGKSQLAARYLWAHVEEFDVVAWVRAADSLADLADLAVQVGVPVEGLAPEDRAAAALEWLESCDEHWLLVVDNVASPDQLMGYPTSGNGRVLVTSRNRDLAQFGPVLTVKVFDDDAGGEYLVGRTGRQAEHDAARRLSHALGGLPLALAHAGAYCSTGTSFEQYLTLLGELPVAELFDTSPDVAYAQTVANTWRVSIDEVAQQAPLGRRVLAMAAFLAPDKIPVALFHVLLADETDPRQRKSLIDGLHALHRYSLADLDDTALTVHRLLQKTERDHAADQGDVFGSQSALSALNDVFPADTDLPSRWTQCEQLMAHVDALRAAWPGPETEPPTLVKLLNRASSYLYRTGGGQRAVDRAEAVNDLAERLLGAEHRDTLIARSNLALIYQSAGRPGDAIPIFEQDVADSERLLGAEHPDTLTARTNLAASYQWAGNADDAIPIFEQVIADSERLLGADDPETLTVRANLAASYASAGRSGDAIAIEERVVADSERVLGSEHPDTLRAQSNLAVFYGWAERSGDAIAIEERVVADSERVLGAEHPFTLNARASLASFYQSAERTADAIAIEERVVADSERLLGAENPITLNARASLAVSYRSAERTADSIAIFEPVVADSERVLGAENPITLNARFHLALSYWSAGRTGDAIATLERVVADQERLLGAEHPDTLAFRSSLQLMRDKSTMVGHQRATKSWFRRAHRGGPA